MHKILVLGAGRIGVVVAALLADQEEYEVHLADLAFRPSMAQFLHGVNNIKTTILDASVQHDVKQYIEGAGITAVISCLPYYCNLPIAKVAVETHVHYYDLSEDLGTVNQVQALGRSTDKVFASQFGLSPGLISIISQDMIKSFETVSSVKMRVGALPASVSNALHYALSWSTEGLINEYTNRCLVLDRGQVVSAQALDGIEEIKIDGLTYEAFHTAGGVSSLIESYAGQINTMNYKTLRYPGHGQMMRFLIHDLQLADQRDLLRQVLENAVPQVTQDVVILYVAVQGIYEGQLIEKHYTRKFYPQHRWGRSWSAIQMVTASALCSIVDLTLQTPRYSSVSSLVPEDVAFTDVCQNRFGRLFDMDHGQESSTVAQAYRDQEELFA